MTLMKTEEGEAGGRVLSLSSADSPCPSPEPLPSLPLSPPRKTICGFGGGAPSPEKDSGRTVSHMWRQTAGRAERINSR